MILVRSPLRFTICGGLDLEPFCSTYGGMAITCTIDKYIYVAINHTFQPEIFLRYSEYEKICEVDEIKHPILREAIKLFDFDNPQLEVVSIADVPSNGSGLGNSGSFSIALIKALFAYKNISVLPDKIAEIACDININKLKFVQGKQDEYACSLGGFQVLEFGKDGSVNHQPLKLSDETLIDLEENLMLVYTGINHKTNDILKKVQDKLISDDPKTLEYLFELKEIANNSKIALENGNIDQFANLMNMQWENKNKRSGSNEYLDEIRFELLNNGCSGAKIIGAGQGGFFGLYAEDKNKVRRYLKEKHLQELRFGFDFSGVKQII